MYTNERMATGNLVIEKAEKNPDTNDNIQTNIVMGGISLIIIASSMIYLKKNRQTQ